MARKQVEQVQCDRCKRVELMPARETEKTEPDFHANLNGEVLEYSDICSRCRGTIERAMKGIKEWDRELNQSLLGVGPAVPNGQAPPTMSAPSYVPPKPHSR